MPRGHQPVERRMQNTGCTSKAYRGDTIGRPPARDMTPFCTLRQARFQTLQVGAASAVALWIGAPALVVATFAACLQLLVAFRRTGGSDEQVQMFLVATGCAALSLLLQVVIDVDAPALLRWLAGTSPTVAMSICLLTFAHATWEAVRQSRD